MFFPENTGILCFIKLILRDSKVKYRSARIEDLAILQDMEQAVINAERPFNQDIKQGLQRYYNLEALIRNKSSNLLVAESYNDKTPTIIASGYADIRESKSYLKHERHSYLGFMYVAPDQRGSGVIQTLINRLKTWSIEQGVNDFYLDVYAHNTAAIRAYEKLGFQASMIEMKLGSNTDAN